jgi:hypothetical protein
VEPAFAAVAQVRVAASDLPNADVVQMAGSVVAETGFVQVAAAFREQDSGLDFDFQETSALTIPESPCA